MLSSAERLNREDFKKTLQNKDLQVVYNRIGTLKYVFKETKAFSVVTSSKHEKSAVKRNKIRRTMYVLFQKTNPLFRGILYTAKDSYGFSHSNLKELFYDLLAKVEKNSK